VCNERGAEHLARQRAEEFVTVWAEKFLELTCPAARGRSYNSSRR